ncbi:MAG: DUF1850 domain-containing protein [Bacillota bacterium]|nr:DUF1850 domain-containing protein [Bacillota bacterium]MDW7678035.1 DUF1850 domain-containing protein [Bacillota bacterium]
MKEITIKKSLIQFSVGICVLFVILGLIPLTVLQITEENRQPSEKRLVSQWRAEAGDTFHITWTHSVTNQPVKEVYQINDNLMIGIQEMFFNEHGPNLPFGPEGGTQWEIRDGMFRVYNYDTVFEALPVRIGQIVADHTLYYQEHIIALREVSRPGGFVMIRARRINVIRFLFEEGKLWLTKKKIRNI